MANTSHAALTGLLPPPGGPATPRPSRAMYGAPQDAVFGSRVARLGSRVRRRAVRHFLGRLFATVATVLLKVRAYDSQCGAKVFRPAVAARCFREPFVTRWLFDLEVLLRLRGGAVREYPLAKWHDVAGSKMKILPNVWRTIADLLPPRQVRNTVKRAS